VVRLGYVTLGKVRFCDFSKEQHGNFNVLFFEGTIN
jgi:hypothetical protein